MTKEQIERLHDQARNEMGFCVQASDANWCDAHDALKIPAYEACVRMSLVYVIAESAGEVMEEMVHDDLRAKVKTLPTVPSLYDGIPILPDPATIAGVLALIDGGSDD